MNTTSHRSSVHSRKFTIVRWLALMALVVWAMGGCSGHRELMPTPNLYIGAAANPFADVVPAYQTCAVDMMYATDRVPSEEKGATEYGWDRSPSLAYGACTVQIGEADLTWDDLVRNSLVAKRDAPLPMAVASIKELGRYPNTPHLDAQANEQAKQTDAALLTEFKRRLALTPRKEAFIFIHGYHDSFDTAACIGAEMWHFLGREGVPIVYTWPAGHGGLLKGYDYDQESGQFTVYHLKNFLMLLASCPELESISILAHSRGTVVTVDAVREMLIAARHAGQNPLETCKLNNIVLAAADLDISVAVQRAATETLGGIRRTTAYVSQTDKALGLSGWLFADRRLGRLDYADLTPFEQDVLLHAKTTAIVDSRIHTKGIGHGYFHSVPAVSSDVILVLRYDRNPGADNGRPLTEIGPNFWEIGKGYPEDPTIGK